MQIGGRRALLIVATASVIGWTHAQLPTTSAVAPGDSFLPDPNLAKIASVGFDALAADLYWFGAVQIAGDDAGTSGHSHYLGALIDLVTELNPWVDHPYRFAGLWMTDDLDAVRKANALLERGIERHPHEWRNRFYLAFNHFYYLDQRAEAADALGPAIGLPGAPAYLGSLVARLRSSKDGLDASAAFLRELIARAPDERARAGYVRAIAEIETERRARILDRARQSFLARHGRDIMSVEELRTVAPAVLKKIPAEPHGAHWELSEDGVIVSSKLQFRYVPKIDEVNQRLIKDISEKTVSGGSDS